MRSAHGGSGLAELATVVRNGERRHSRYCRITEVSGLCGIAGLRCRGLVRDIESGLLEHRNEHRIGLCGCRGPIAAVGLCFSNLQAFILRKI